MRLTAGLAESTFDAIKATAMRKLFIVCLIVVIAIVNVKALLHGNKQARSQEASTAVKPLRVQLEEVHFVLLPACFKA